MYSAVFLLDYGSDFLWADDQETEDLYGYQIDLVQLGIPDTTLALHEFVSYLYHMRLNPIYQNFPSFWSGEMHLFFQQKVVELYNGLKVATKDRLKIAVSESAAAEMNDQIDVALINDTLKNFVSDPVGYCIRNKVLFNSEAFLKNEVEQEYKKWKNEEQQILGA